MNNNNNNNAEEEEGGEVLAPWDSINTNPTAGPGANLTPAQTAAWRERERRQRSIRLVMMFMLMLLLMDSEEQAVRKRSENRKKRERQHRSYRLTPEVFGARRTQEKRLKELTQKHPRYAALNEKNQGKDVPADVLSWAETHAEMVKDEFVVVNADAANDKDPQEKQDPEEKNRVFHYPWNATGFYRGEWTRDGSDEKEEGEEGEESTAEETKASEGTEASSTSKDNPEEKKNVIPVQYVDARALESEMRVAMEQNSGQIGLVLLPAGKEVLLRHDHNNFTSYDWNLFSSMPPENGADHYFMRTSDKIANSNGKGVSATGDTTKEEETSEDDDDDDDEVAAVKNPSIATAKVTLTKPSGRAAFQLFSRAVPGMQEISLVDGFLKLYDSNMLGYSTHKDVLLRVQGVLLHAIGRMSLVANAGQGRSVLLLGDQKNLASRKNDVLKEQIIEDEVPLEQRRRRLQEALEMLDSNTPVGQIRDDAIMLFGSDKLDVSEGQGSSKAQENYQFKFESISELAREHGGVNATGNPEHSIAKEEEKLNPTDENGSQRVSRHLTKASSLGAPESSKKSDMGGKQLSNEKFAWSDVLIPYPFVFDDENGTIRNTKTAAARKMPPREQLLEQNAGICEFEVVMDAKEVEWNLGDWRKLLERRVREAINLNPANKPLEPEDSETEKKEDKRHRLSYSGSSSSKSARSSREHHSRKAIQDEALVMTMTGSIHSHNCDFGASLNVTALRTDWEHTTTKAINYSFYMMLTCLTQIMVLLRQLLHTQARSSATRVSLLCIGWQTMIDAMLCLGHIYLSLAIKPLFTAFASVAFFKWLIFCFIEMKYWTLIVQARNSTNGGNTTTEQLRRQVAMLHCRFYGALFVAKVVFSFVGEKYRILFALVLYSFWVPQIVQNVITEAKRPMHNWYIYGMSLSRLVAPLYFFAVPNNFLKEVYPESPTDPLMCELLVLWVGIQTAILIGQGKYGARFMIPARFLPPKFDYSRPIPQSLLPPGVSQEEIPTVQEPQAVVPIGEPVVRDRRTTTRNRNRGSRMNHQESSMTTEIVVNSASTDSAHTLDCVICYNSIDVQNRRGYMLAPCDHIFHRDCLVQWMDVKMECPICRTELPTL